MVIEEDLIKRCIFDTPLALTSLSQDKQNIVNSLMPFDTGIEIECGHKEARKYKLIEEANKVENIKHVFISDDEKRFRIPGRIEGMICLYKITILMKEYALLNKGSGIHYHTDLTEIYDEKLVNRDLLNNVKPFLLEQLDTWDYKGTYNRRDVQFQRCWVRFDTYKKTMEIRIGEMTFEYERILKRILHCQYLAKYVMNAAYNKSHKVHLYQEKLKELKKTYTLNLEEVKAVVNNRVVRI